jgi:hypothetical protein
MDIATGQKVTDARQLPPEELVGTLLRLIREVRFGSIEIIVHEGRITQIERREKLRFNSPAPMHRE